MQHSESHLDHCRKTQEARHTENNVFVFKLLLKLLLPCSCQCLLCTSPRPVCCSEHCSCVANTERGTRICTQTTHEVENVLAVRATRLHVYHMLTCLCTGLRQVERNKWPLKCSGRSQCNITHQTHLNEPHTCAACSLAHETPGPELRIHNQLYFRTYMDSSMDEMRRWHFVVKVKMPRMKMIQSVPDENVKNLKFSCGSKVVLWVSAVVCFIVFRHQMRSPCGVTDVVNCVTIPIVAGTPHLSPCWNIFSNITL